MRRDQRIKLIWLVLALEVLVLAVLPTPVRYRPRASVLQDATGITFRLDQHNPRDKPRLVLSGRRNLNTLLAESVTTGSSTLVRLKHTGIDPLHPANLISYGWDVGRERITGAFAVAHPDFAYPWRVKENEEFTLFYVEDEAANRLYRWADVYIRWARRFETGAEHRTIFAFPDRQGMVRALALTQDQLKGDVVGIWVPRSQSLMLTTDLAVDVQDQIVAHELTHAMLANKSPIWWDEGIALYVELQEAKRDPRRSRPPEMRTPIARLAEAAGTRPVALDSLSRDGEFPFDPYTVGMSVVLYVRSRYGEPALYRLASAAAKLDFDDALNRVLRLQPAELQTGWLEYLRSGRVLADARSI